MARHHVRARFAARRATTATAAALLALCFGLSGCAVTEPEAAVTPPKPGGIYSRKPVNQQAQLEVAAAYKAACLETPLDLSGADRALRGLGYSPAPGPDDVSVWRKGRALAELRIGERRPVTASNCLVAHEALDRYQALAALNQAIASSGLRYEARTDLEQLGDPFAHDARGTAIGSDYWGVAALADLRTGSGASMVKSPKKRE